MYEILYYPLQFFDPPYWEVHWCWICFFLSILFCVLAIQAFWIGRVPGPLLKQERAFFFVSRLNRISPATYYAMSGIAAAISLVACVAFFHGRPVDVYLNSSLCENPPKEWQNRKNSFFYPTCDIGPIVQRIFEELERNGINNKNWDIPDPELTDSVEDCIGKVLREASLDVASTKNLDIKRPRLEKTTIPKWIVMMVEVSVIQWAIHSQNVNNIYIANGFDIDEKEGWSVPATIMKSRWGKVHLLNQERKQVPKNSIVKFIAPTFIDAKGDVPQKIATFALAAHDFRGQSVTAYISSKNDISQMIHGEIKENLGENGTHQEDSHESRYKVFHVEFTLETSLKDVDPQNRKLYLVDENKLSSVLIRNANAQPLLSVPGEWQSTLKDILDDGDFSEELKQNGICVPMIVEKKKSEIDLMIMSEKITVTGTSSLPNEYDYRNGEANTQKLKYRGMWSNETAPTIYSWQDLLIIPTKITPVDKGAFVLLQKSERPTSSSSLISQLKNHEKGTLAFDFYIGSSVSNSLTIPHPVADDALKDVHANRQNLLALARSICWATQVIHSGDHSSESLEMSREQVPFPAIDNRLLVQAKNDKNPSVIKIVIALVGTWFLTMLLGFSSHSGLVPQEHLSTRLK